MAKFAQYYLKYLNDNLFAQSEWGDRQKHLGEFLLDANSILFSDKTLPEVVNGGDAEQFVAERNQDGEKPKVKVYKHKVYHLNANDKIIVMRLANVKIIPIEKDFKPDTVEHYPSVFIIIDNRDGCRRVSIQKLSTSFSNTDQVAKILQKAFNDNMEAKWHIGVEMNAQRYPMDFYKLWRAQQHHAARIKFGISPDEESKARKEVFDKKREKEGKAPITQSEADDSMMSYILSMAEESEKSGYKTSVEIESKQKGAVLYVDESSEYIRNLVTYSAMTATTIELITSDGASFECYIDTDMESDDKIVTREFETAYLEALFENEITDEVRANYETKVVEYCFDTKRVVDDKEEEVQNA